MNGNDYVIWKCIFFFVLLLQLRHYANGGVIEEVVVRFRISKWFHISCMNRGRKTAMRRLSYFDLISIFMKIAISLVLLCCWDEKHSRDPSGNNIVPTTTIRWNAKIHKSCFRRKSTGEQSSIENHKQRLSKSIKLWNKFHISHVVWVCFDFY